MTTIADPTRGVILGVDTHEELHIAVVIDLLGTCAGHDVDPRDPSWLRPGAQLGETTRRVLTVAGVEGTGSYGAGLAPAPAAARGRDGDRGRPARSQSPAAPRAKKSATAVGDAFAAAVASGDAPATPKTRDGLIEAIGVLHVARRGAVKARTAAINQIKGLITTAPAALREHLATLDHRRTGRHLRPAAPGPQT